MQARANIDIQIDVLQVEQPGQLDAVSLQRAIERELSTLLTSRGVPSLRRHSHSITGIATEWNETPAGEDEPLAASIAAAVYQALGR